MRHRKFSFEPATIYRSLGLSLEKRPSAKELLNGWQKQTRYMVEFSNHQTTQLIIEACHSTCTLSMFYQGGSDRGRFRKFTPESVFRTEDSMVTYVTGFCHLRQAHRILRTDRISLG